MQTFLAWTAASLAAVMAALGPAAAANTELFSDWGKLSNEVYGFELSYPVSVFAGNKGVSRSEGHMLISRDGAARLAVATFLNESGASLSEYREQLLNQNYRGADLDYAPLKSQWFILSGTTGNMEFYERVTFTCGGRLINSWALLYPASESRFYSHVVEAIAPTYLPGAGRGGACP